VTMSAAESVTATFAVHPTKRGTARRRR
jgi:hypothetical protein